MRRVSLSLWLASLVAAAPGVARAQTADCSLTDAPSPFDSASCNAVCSLGGDIWTCDPNALCSGNQVDAIIVHDYDALGNHDYVAWGNCPGGGPSFCCTHDEQVGNPVNQIHLKGTPDPDERLSFHFDPGFGGTVNNLAPAHAHPLRGFIYAGDGDDFLIQGSDHVGANYRDNLYGERGDDYMEGLGDFDWMDGGPGDDDMRGNEGSDRMVGRDGDDELDGGPDHDTLCDTTGDSVCISAGGQVFTGGTGNDVFWHDDTATCPTTDLSGASNAGFGNDICGDDTDFPLLWTGCVFGVNVEPAECTDPN